MGNAIKGVGWLTFLDDDFMQTLGGETRLATAADGNVTFTQLRRGCVLQAGTAPILGDRNTHEDVEAYRRVFNWVKSCVVQDDMMLPGFGEGESLDWVRRFA